MIIRADARSIPLKDNCVQTCVTSPPYWGLRDYGVAGQIGLEATPDEYVATMVAVFREVRRVLRDDGTVWLNLGDSYAGQNLGYTPSSPSNQGVSMGIVETHGPFCRICFIRNCTRHPPERHLPDCENPFKVIPPYDLDRKKPSKQSTNHSRGRHKRMPPGLKAKDLCGIPWRVAFALQADGAASPAHMETIRDMIAAVTDSYDTRDEWPNRIRQTVERLEREWIDAHRGGWYLRSDIIWSKPNPMPESVTDRPTRAHEYIFLLSKSERYFYDREAIAEPLAASSIERVMQPNFANQNGGPKDYGGNRSARKGLENLAAKIRTSGDYGHGAGRNDGDNHPSGGFPAPALRNKRDVWSVNSEPTPEAHFATFPRKLIEPCILAGTSERGCCSECGAPRVRMTENTPMVIARSTRTHPLGRTRASGTMLQPPQSVTTGWQPSCGHDAPTVPCLVFDPFIGSGTTGIVAEQFGRRWIGLDLSENYLSQIARKRTAQMGLGL